MKKLLSVIVMVAMLVTAMLPAFATMAADALALGTDEAYLVKNADGLGEATTNLAITANPGFSDISLMLYYDTANVNVSAVEAADSPYFDYLSVGSAKKSILAAVKKHFTAAGVATSATIYGIQIDINVANVDTGEPITMTDLGNIANLVVTSVAGYSELTAESSVEIGYFFISANNADGVDVAYPAPTTISFTLDPWASYAETEKSFDTFTFAVDDMIAYQGKTIVDVPVKIYGNENNENGFYSSVLLYYFPKEIKLVDIIYNSAELPAITDITWNKDYCLKDAYEQGEDLNGAIKEAFENAGLDWQNMDVYCTTVFPDVTDTEVTGSTTVNAIYYTLRFEIPADAKPGTKWEIKMMGNSKDTTGFVGGTTVDDLKPISYGMDDGYIKVRSKDGSCDHANTTEVIVTEATCTSVGYKNIVCADCGEILEANVEIPMANHQYSSVVTDPTCTVDGYTTYTCDVCGDSYVSDTVTAPGHTAGERVVTSEPTYDAEGAYEIRCSVCGELLETGSIPKLVKTGISVGSAASKPGNTVVVPVSVSDNTGMFITRLTVTYDATKLAFVEAVNGEVFADATNVLFTKVEDGNLTLYFEAADNADVTANGVLANLKFNVIDDETIVGATDIAVTVEDATNYAGEDLVVETANGTVTIAANQKITVPAKEVEILKDVEVPVAIEANEGVWALRLEVAYDANLLTFKSVKSGLFTLNEGEHYSVANGVITVFVDAADMENVIADGTLFTLAFTAGDAEGVSAIDVTVLEAIDVDSNDVALKVFDGSVTVIPCKHTDYTTEVTKAPSVEEEGVLSYICSNCGEIFKTEPIARLAGVTVGTVSAEAGAPVAVPVTISTNPGTYSLSMEFAYDTDALTFVNVTSGLFTADEFSASVHDGVLTVYVEADAVENITGDGVAFTLNFTAANTAEGTYAIDGTLVAENTVNVDSEEVAFAIVDGAVDVANNFVARIGDAYFTDLRTAFEAAVDGDVVVITKDFSYGVDEDWKTSGVVIREKKVTLDLAGHTVTADFGEGNNNWCGLYIFDSELTVTGDGTFTAFATTGGYVFHVVRSDLYIENGTFSGNPTVVNVQVGTAYIRGGRFSTPDEDKRYVLNCIDANYKNGTADIVVTGGYFLDFDPANCAAEGAGTDFVPVDYKSIAAEEEGWFTVVPCDPHDYVETDRVDSTCTEAGHVTYTCANCGRTYDEDLELADHTPGEWTVVTEATAGADGREAIFCTVCGEELDSRVIPALGFIHKVSGNDYVKSAELDGDTIKIITSGTAIDFAKFAIGYTAGITLDAEGVNLTNVTSTWAYVTLDLPTDGGTVTCTDSKGISKTYTVEVTASPSSYKYYTAVAGGYTVESVDSTTEADTFFVYAKPNVDNATLMIQIPAVNKYTYSDGLTIVTEGNNVYFKAYAATDNQYTITVTTPNGGPKTYTVNYVFNNDYYLDVQAGYTVSRVDSTTEADTFYVYAKANVKSAALMLQIPAANTYSCSEGLTIVKNGTYVYFKAMASAQNNMYTITVTTPDGVAKDYTVYYMFESIIAGCQGGYMVDDCSMDGKTINITVSGAYSYASFRGLFKNTTTTIQCPDDIDVVMSGSIHWFKIYNDGTGSVTKQITATDATTGITEVYTVNVTFGA